MIEPPKYTLEYLNDSNVSLVNSFCSGNFYIDNNLKGYKCRDLNYGKTVLFLSEDRSCIFGFFNITTGYVAREDNGKFVKCGGSIHINDFAIDQKYQNLVLNENPRIKFSDMLFRDCIDHIKEIRRQTVGITFITLESTEMGLNLYKRNNFELISEFNEDLTFAKDEGVGMCAQMFYAFDWDV